MSDPGGKVAIITGASRGIGAVIAERLAQDGFAVLVNYATNDDAAESLVQKITEAGGTARAMKADVSDPVAVQQMFETAEEVYGGIDVLVNNAGIVELAAIGDMDDAAFDRLIAVNVKGTFNTLREAARRLRPGGHIINFSSSVADLQRPTYGPYAATKAAVETMTRIMSKELREHGITVNAVKLAPAAADAFLEARSPEQAEQPAGHPAAEGPLQRPARPEEIANLVAFLAGPDAGWINGRNLRANAGAGVERLLTPPSPPAWRHAARRYVPRSPASW